MQFGIFTVGDVTPDPTTGRAPTEHERIKATIAIAQKAEEVGLDVFATGEHHNPPFVAVRADHDAGVHRRADRAAHPLDVDDAHHDERPGADRRGLRDAAAPRRRPRRPDAGPRQHRPGLPVVRQGHPRGHPARHRELRPAAPAVARGRRRLGGQVPHAAAGLHRRRRARWTACRRSCGTARSAAPRSPSRPRTTATASSPTTSSGRPRTPSDGRPLPRSASSTTATAAPTRRSSASAARSSCARTARTRCASSGPTSTTRRSTATARRWRSSPRRRRSPSAARSRSSSGRSAFRDYVGDYQRQLFLVDHAGLPLKTVLEQLDLLGEEVVPGAAQGVRRAARPRTCRTRRRTPAWSPQAARRAGAEPRPAEVGVDDRAQPRRRDGGLSQPSSTRLLADRLAAATDRALRLGDDAVDVEVIELRELAHDITDNLLTGFPSTRLREAHRGGASAPTG